MIYIDYNNLMNVQFHGAVSRVMHKRWGNEGKLGNPIEPPQEEVDNLRKAFYSSMIVTIKDIESKYQQFGNIFIATDTPKSWRVYYYPFYKQNRRDSLKEQNTYDKWLFNHMIEWSNQIKDALKVVGYPLFEGYIDIEGKRYGLEADDIIGVLAQQFINEYEKHLIISNDGDFKQIESKRCLRWDYQTSKPVPPMSQEMRQKWLIEQLLLGQKKDNVPNIKEETLLSAEFVDYFNKHNEDGLEIAQIDIDKSSIWIDLGEKFIQEKNLEEIKMVESGKKKRPKSWTVYQDMRFGPKAVEEFMKGLKDNLASYKPWLDNFVRNRKLLLFKEIPEEIQQYIKEESDELLKSSSKPKGLQKMKLQKQLIKDGLTELANLV